MIFEWDAAASEATFAKRGFDFEYASRMFRHATLESRDLRNGRARTAVAAVGDVDGQTFHVIYIETADVRRIVSARPASRKERKRWLSFVRI